MFERFTDQARQAVVLAQEEARLLRHNYIGTEHLLLGLVAPEGTIASEVLRAVGLDLEQARDDVVAVVGRGGRTPDGHIPFTPRAKQVMELSLREALRLDHGHIGSEHLLLGLIREGQGVAAQILFHRCGDLSNLRVLVEQALKEPGPAPAAAGEMSASLRAVPVRQTPAAREVADLARQLAASGPVGSHHLLEALARTPGSAAGQALAILGIDPDTLAAAVDQVDLDGTTDLTPVEAAARRLVLTVADDGSTATITVGDEATVALAQTLMDQVGGPVRGDDPVVGSLAGLWRALDIELSNVLDHLASAPAPLPDDPAPGPLRQAIQGRLRRRRRPPADPLPG